VIGWEAERRIRAAERSGGPEVDLMENPVRRPRSADRHFTWKRATVQEVLGGWAAALPLSPCEGLRAIVDALPARRLFHASGRRGSKSCDVLLLPPPIPDGDK
jgi:hypothetical protein